MRLLAKKVAQLTFMMLSVDAASGKKGAQLMRMMPGMGGQKADAHDAGRGCGVWEKEAQLMLMMLGGCGVRA